jgi:hypothetical protein
VRRLLVLVLACGGESTPRSDPTPEPDQPRPPDAAVRLPDAAVVATNPQPGLTVTVNGKPVIVQSVLASDEGNGQVEITFKNYGYTCKELTEGFTTRSSEPTDFEMKFRTGKYLHADGKLGWAIRGAYTVIRDEPRTSTWQQEKQSGGDPLGDAAIDPAAGTTFELPLAFEMKRESDPPRTIVMKGTAKVTGCGDGKFKSKDPPPVPQPGATITIAGQTLPIAGAAYIVKKDGNRELLVSTHAAKCVDGSESLTTRADVAISLAFDKTGKLYNMVREGSWVEWGIKQGLAPGDPRLTAALKGGAKETLVTLGGSSTIQGYPVALAGKVKAIVCPTPK